MRLTQSTLIANARFFPGGVPPANAYTVGMKTILGAKSVLLIAGEEKYRIVKRAFTGEITPRVPASILQTHSHATVIYVGEEEL